MSRGLLVLCTAVCLQVSAAFFGLVHAAPEPISVAKYRDSDSSTLTAIMRSRPFSTDRPEAWRARLSRLAPAAAAIDAAASTSERRATLLALGQHESAWATYVGEDRCEDGPPGARCDEGKARGFWQLHRAACPTIWNVPPSPERLLLEARCALAVFDAAAAKCGRERAFGGYRGDCEVKDAPLRARSARTFGDVLVNGWPAAPAGWERDPAPSLLDRRASQKLRLSPGEWREVRPGVGALGEWHFHEFGGDTSPRGWHEGVTLFRTEAR